VHIVVHERIEPRTDADIIAVPRTERRAPWGADLHYGAASARRATSAQRAPPLSSQAAKAREPRARG